MNKIKWGILGYGQAAQKFYSSIKDTRASEIFGIASKSKYNQLSKNKYIKVFSNYEDLINLKDLDIVYISLINSLHFENLDKCINANKKILVEKPSCSNYSELRKVSDKIINHKIYFKECILYLSHPIIENVKKIIQNNDIGNLRCINSNYGFNFNKKRFFFFKKKKNKKFFSKKLEGGVINNFAHYPLSSFLVFSNSGIYPSISSIACNSKIKNGIEVEVQAELNFDNGIACNTYISLIKNLDSKLELVGDKGSIIVENPWLPKKNYTIILKNKNNTRIYEFTEKKNLWEFEIEKIEEDLRKNKIIPSVEGTEIDASLKYLEYIHIWKKKIFHQSNGRGGRAV